MFAATDPLHQFEITRLARLELFGLDVSFTNSALFMGVGVALLAALFWLGARTDGALVPTRLQSVLEMIYEFVEGMVKTVIGPDGLRFFPIVFTVFAFILAANLIGMFPYAFTVTSHLSVTGALAILVFVIVLGVSLKEQGLSFFKRFFPSGVPLPVLIILTPVEIISFLIRPFTLAVRLFANMLAGHMMLKVLAGFIPLGLGLGATLLGPGLGGVLAAIGAAFGVVAVTALEFLVAALQAYVFAILTCVYLAEAVHEPHH